MHRRYLPALFVATFAFAVSCDRKPDPREEAAAASDAALDLQREIERERLALERARLEFDRDRAIEEAARAREALETAKGEQALAEARARAAEAERALAEANARESVAKAEREAAETVAKADEAARAKAAASSAKGAAPIQALPLQHQAPGYRPGPDYSLFYEQLAPHGSWFQTIEYGYVWQPAVARRDRGWRPYTVGRWLDTDQGWAWWSDEPFGWAAYHYGRWTEFDRVGWIWVPGPDWAPAWVSWRVSDSHIGWAPLPPVTVYETTFNYGDRTDAACGIPPHHYNFVPTRAFAEPVRTHTLPPTQSVTLVQQTVNVTHIHARDTTVFVEGPRPEPLRRQFGDRLPRHTIDRRERWDADRGAHPEPRMERGRLEYSAPRVAPAPEAQARPSLLAGVLEQLMPAHASARPDANLLQNFARERAKLGAPAPPLAPSAPSVGAKAKEPVPPKAPSSPKPAQPAPAAPAKPKAAPSTPPADRNKAKAPAPPKANRPTGAQAAPQKNAPKPSQPAPPTPVAPPKPAAPQPAPPTAPVPSVETTPPPAPVSEAPAPMAKPEPAPQPEPAPVPEPPAPKPEPEPEPVPQPAPDSEAMAKPEALPDSDEAPADGEATDEEDGDTGQAEDAVSSPEKARKGGTPKGEGKGGKGASRKGPAASDQGATKAKSPPREGGGRGNGREKSEARNPKSEANRGRASGDR